MSLIFDLDMFSKVATRTNAVEANETNNVSSDLIFISARYLSRVNNYVKKTDFKSKPL